jgi:Zn finger protein HypA/HybF involved in hydrogenase expression
MIRKFAKADILDVRYSSDKLSTEQLGEGFAKLAKPSPITDDGFLYVTVRAISSRVNKNNDGWPSLELARTDPGYGYKTFEGRPIFIDHNNDDPDRTRGVVVSSKLHVDDVEKASSFDPYYSTAPENHLPPTWIELMLEVDAKEYPKLAKEIASGNIDSVSMGANIEISKCSVCDHEAENPTEYCAHVKMKGATFEVESSDGSKSHKKAYEDCYGVNFFEISFVFDPADETALVSDMSPERKAARQAIASLEAAGAPVPDDLRKQAAGVYDQEDDPRDVAEAPVGYEGEEAPGHELSYDPTDVGAWRKEQFMHLGLSGEEADRAIAAGIDWHSLADFLEQHPSARPDQALRIITPLEVAAKTAALERDVELMKLGDDGAAAAQLFRQLRTQGVPTREAMQQVAERFFDGQYGAAQSAVSKNVQLTGATTPKSTVDHFKCGNCGETWTGDLDEQDSCPKCGSSKVQVTSARKEAIGPPGKDHHNLDHHRQDVERERELNHEPQADKMTAPEQVDTLRPEIVCKNCGSKVEPDNAGQLICQECGYEVEPEGLDNPDLELAKDIDLRQDNTEQVNPEGEMQTELEPDKGETEMPGKAPNKSPVRPVAPISSTQTDHVKDEMKFSNVKDAELTANPEVVKAVVAFMDKKSIQVEDEIELARILNESEEFEGSPTIYETAEAVEHVASALDNADSKTDTKVVTDKQAPSGSTSAQQKGEKIISDQLAPVESNTKFETLAETESKETSTEETDMAEETKTADRETIKREETDGSGVTRTEEITKEFGPMGGDGEGSEEPTAEGDTEEEEVPAEGEAEGEESTPTLEGDAEEVKNEGEESTDGLADHNLSEEEKVPAMASNEEGKLMAALKLAKLASGLGVITSDEELEFAGELEQGESLAEIEARSKMLERVKEAGLSKKLRPVVAGRVPSFRSAGTLPDEVEDADDSALFL